MNRIGVLIILSLAAAVMQAAEQRPVRVLYNLDCSAFFTGEFGPQVPETIDKFVETHAAAGVTDLFINVNGQRTNYRSSVWESEWDGFDPNAGDDQPFLAAIDPKRRSGPDANEAQYYRDIVAFQKHGCDYGKRMIDSARGKKVKAWISLRMNDAHAPDKPNYPGHSTFWRSHPEWWLSSGPNPTKESWSAGALDYEIPEVREHYMKLIKEVCSRYDMDGLELDYLRFDLYFRPGRETVGGKLMTEFVEQTRKVTQEAAKKWGHPVQLAVRVPTTPWIARMHGLDAVAWAKAGLVDLITASPFWISTNSDIPVETWKGLLKDTQVVVAVAVEDGINSGASGRRRTTPEEMRGIFLSGLQRGADGVYFFNYFTYPYLFWPHATYYQLLKDAGSYEALSKLPRCHPITLTSPWSEGEPTPESILPYKGTHGVFRVATGPKPLPKQHVQVELTVPDHKEPLDVRVNGLSCSAIKGKQHEYAVPADALNDGYNLVEVVAKQKIEITWVEVSIQ
jgi:hypothetical protein